MFYMPWKVWAWKVFTLPPMGVIYVAVISEGLRFLVPALGQKLWKLPIPGFSLLRDYEWSHRLDLAYFLALFLLVAVCVLWELALALYLGFELPFERAVAKPDNYRRLVVILAVAVLGGDACLFYCAMTQLAWSGNSFSIPALLATVCYLAVIVFVSFLTVRLKYSDAPGLEED